MDLSNIRGRIDGIDSELLRLLLERMECSRQVAEFKLANNLDVLNSAREAEILQRISQESGIHKDGASLVFTAIMEASRALQHNIMGGGASLRELLKQGVNPEESEEFAVENRQINIACQGVPGAYSGEAAELLYPDASINFVEGFGDVFDAVGDGRADFGVVPVENSTAGSVTEAYDLLLAHKYYVNRSLTMKISHCLLGLPDGKISDLREVYSHPQGLLQCSEFLKSHNLRGIHCGNTAAAALKVANSGDSSLGAVASRGAAARYGLKILAENIQNYPLNRTRFISISKKLFIPEDADKISLSFSLPHKTGSLYRILARFATSGLNLTKIESRPYKSENFQYLFYLDFEGNLRNEATVDTLCTLSEELPDFAFLGNYRGLDLAE